MPENKITPLVEKVFFEIHSDNPREGPGNFTSTQKAFLTLKNISKKPKILDIGCGPGQQTIDLAKLSTGIIYAVDNYPPYLSSLLDKVQNAGLKDRIIAVEADMNNLQFERESFDIIWAEGSIYLMGFELGLKKLGHFLKHNGYLAVTEISWLKENPPEDVAAFWQDGYSAMQNVAANISIIQKLEYKLIDHFVLPETAWWDDYYKPIEQKLVMLRSKYHNKTEVLQLIENEQNEIDLYRKYSNYYGYVFYVMQKK